MRTQTATQRRREESRTLLFVGLCILAVLAMTYLTPVGAGGM